LSDKPNSFETIERPERGDKKGFHEFRNTPDFYNPLYPSVAEFVYKASQVLTEFRKQWKADHPEDSFAGGLELDVTPVMTDGMVMGYMFLSEIDGETYDYAPTKSVQEESQ
jgi:hypothetical protein